MQPDHLRFAPEILRRLGEELIPHPDQGVVELARNSYDADARECIVELQGTERTGGSVTISDDGLGMTRADISNGWLVVGRSSKQIRQRTPRFSRLPAGDKGLGRLAALRMGRLAVVRTRPESEPGIEYEVKLDWSRFDQARVVEDVAIDVNVGSTSAPPGTSIEICDLSVPLTRSDVGRLARSLILLADPFSTATSFRPRLVSDQFTDLQERVNKAYFDEAEYRLTAILDSSGRAQVQVFDWAGKQLFRGTHEEVARRDGSYRAPPAAFELWVFLLNRQSFAGRNATITEVQDWLRVVGGVHVYHRGLRVRPYGDAGHDWLDMNLRRARSPEERPSTNTSIGRVTVDDGLEKLVAKTDREGFVENEGFQELRSFAIDALDWTALKRLSLAETSRRRQRRVAREDLKAAKTKLVTAIGELPKKKVIEAAFRTYEAAVQKQITSLQSEVQLYRTLSTIGTTTAVFAHESAKPVTQIEKLANVVRDRGRREFGTSFSALLGEPLEMIRRASWALGSYAKLPLSLLQQEKRRIGRADLHIVISNMLVLLKPFLDDASIAAETEFTDDEALVYGSVAALESIIANLIINAVNAFTSSHAHKGPRKVVVRTQVSADRVLLSILDNGPGIRGISLEQIWLPGRTTMPGGTGIGLTIVRDAVTDLGGAASARANGELGGAEFHIDLPRLESAGRPTRARGRTK